MRTINSQVNQDKNSEEKDNSEIKSVIISKEVHYKLKRYCLGKKLRIGPLVEKMILDFIGKKGVDSEISNNTDLTTDESFT